MQLALFERQVVNIASTCMGALSAVSCFISGYGPSPWTLKLLCSFCGMSGRPAASFGSLLTATNNSNDWPRFACRVVSHEQSMCGQIALNRGHGQTSISDLVWMVDHPGCTFNHNAALSEAPREEAARRLKALILTTVCLEAGPWPCALDS